MRTFRVLGVGIFAWSVILADMPLPGDAQLGAKVFHEQRCVACHSLKGIGGKTAPDLGRRIGRDYTPSLMASLIWNHAPVMWAAMEKQGIERPKLSSEDASNLFAYFWANRYFDKPGDAGRGKQAFAAKHCADCHGLNSAIAGGGPPVSSWDSITDPVALAGQMWNHMAKMRGALAKRGVSWPSLTSQDMTDIVVYLQNLPAMRGKPVKFSPASAQTGQTLFRVKGCADCHHGKLALESRVTGRSMNDLAAALWDHGTRLKGPVQALTTGETRRLVGYLWSIQFFSQPGNAARGREVFIGKKCGACHGQTAPNLTAQNPPLSSFGIVAALWQHGPEMSRKMADSKIAWPHFQGVEMSDLLAYLNSKK